MSLFVVSALSLVVVGTLRVTNSPARQLIIILHLRLSSVSQTPSLHRHWHGLEPIRNIGSEAGLVLRMLVAHSGCLEASTPRLGIVHVDLVAAALISLFYVIRAARIHSDWRPVFRLAHADLAQALRAQKLLLLLLGQLLPLLF